MSDARKFMAATDLDRTTFPAFRECMAKAEAAGTTTEPRTYPGYPCWPLQRLQPRRLISLDRVLTDRRCARKLGIEAISRKNLSRLLQFAHGIMGDWHRGPTPSAGGLQALELYLVNFAADWLPCGVYHYDRLSHNLSQLRAQAERAGWQEHVPSLAQVEGGSLLWLLAGDGARVAEKYSDRSYRFLLLEAGHLMQNLCLVSQSLGHCTIPLGGFFEREIAKELALPPSDLVLYVAACGRIG